MSIEVRVPEEIMDYKEKVIAGLSVRELAFGALAAITSAGTYVGLQWINRELATYATMLVAAPSLLLGFIRPDGRKFEVWLKIKVKCYFSKFIRGYKTNPEAELLPIEHEKYRELLQKEEIEKDKQALEALNAKKNRNLKERWRDLIVYAKEKVCCKKVKATAKREYDLVEVTEASIKRKAKTATKAATKTRRKYRKKK